MKILCILITTLSFFSLIGENKEPLKAGEVLPQMTFPQDWLRGPSFTKLDPNISYIFNFWSPRSFKPGHNVEKLLKKYDGKNVKSIAVFIDNGSSRESLVKRLSLPSQQSLSSVVRLAKDSPISKLFNRMHDGELRAYTMLVRNGVVAWIGDGGLLYKTTIDGTLVKNFEYAPYINKLSKERARNNALYKRLTQDYSKAAKDGNDKLALAILDEVANEPKLSSPLFVTLCTNRCGRFLQRKEFDKALNQMKLIAEKYPKETQAQSWAYKMISNTAELNEIGGEYAGNIAMHLAKNYEGKLAFAWFKAAARSYEGAGKNQKALAALLAAEQKSSAMQKLKQYQKALTK